MEKPLGVILAGGLSRRMGGGDKGLLALGGQTILDRVVERLSPQVNGIVLNANGDPARFHGLGMPVVADSIDGFAGPLAGVLAGLDWARKSGATTIVTAAADTPFFPSDLVTRLTEEVRGMAHPLVLSATRGEDGRLIRHPTFGLWPVALADDLRNALSDGLRKVVLWTDAHGGRVAEFPVKGHDPFFNVNTPDDLEAAQRILDANQ